jgi:hypothetical protein
MARVSASSHDTCAGTSWTGLGQDWEGWIEVARAARVDGAKGGPDQKMCSSRMKKQQQGNMTTMATQAAVPGWSLTDQQLAGGRSRGEGNGPGATNSGRAQRST